MSGLARIGSAPGGGGDDLSNADVDTDQEVTKLVTTPDIQCYEDMEGPDTPSNGGTSSKASTPPPPMHSALSVAPPPHPQASHSHQISNSLHNHSQHNHSAVAAQAAAAAAAIQGKGLLKHCLPNKYHYILLLSVF